MPPSLRLDVGQEFWAEIEAHENGYSVEFIETEPDEDGEGDEDNKMYSFKTMQQLAAFLFPSSISRASHTPGPWVLANHNEIVAANKHESFIAEIFDEADSWKANARLIARAPQTLDERNELLQVCKELLAVKMYARPQSNEEAAKLTYRAVAAIAITEGKA